jgi:hypothetical protein
MSLQMPQPGSDKIRVSEGRTWLRPAFVRLETGEAEANDSFAGDNSGMVS